jgi:hypothetical protein
LSDGHFWLIAQKCGGIQDHVVAAGDSLGDLDELVARRADAHLAELDGTARPSNGDMGLPVKTKDCLDGHGDRVIASGKEKLDFCRHARAQAWNFIVDRQVNRVGFLHGMGGRGGHDEDGPWLVSQSARYM